MHKKLSIFMLISFLLAIICAYLFPDFVVKSKFLGKYFIKILKAFVPFLIFGTITYSIASFDAFSKIKKIRFAALRYFNAAGYDIKKRILGLEKSPQNLIPIVMEAAMGIRKKFDIFGSDYAT